MGIISYNLQINCNPGTVQGWCPKEIKEEALAQPVPVPTLPQRVLGAGQGPAVTPTPARVSSLEFPDCGQMHHILLPKVSVTVLLHIEPLSGCSMISKYFYIKKQEDLSMYILGGFLSRIDMCLSL